MHLKTYLLVGMILVLGMGCGGGGSNSGGGAGGNGSSSYSLVGTWNVVTTNSSSPPAQFVFNADGTGSLLGTSGTVSFIWSLPSTVELIIALKPGPITNYRINWGDNNDVTIAELGDSDSIYFTLKRA